MRWLRSLWDWFLRLFWRRPPAPEPAPRLRTVRIEESPLPAEPGLIYLVGEGNHLWFVVLLCPCGCGETIQLNILPDERPRWDVTSHDDGTLSLRPSVWRVRGCRSHFFVRRGKIDWCPPAAAMQGPQRKNGGQSGDNSFR